MAADATAPEIVVPGAAPRPLRQRLLTIVRILFTVAVLAAVAYTTITQWRDVKAYLASIPWQSATLALILVLVGLFGSTMAWRAAAADVGEKVSVNNSSQIYLIGLLGKYLPGSVWAYVMQMELGRRAGLQRSRAFIASVVVTGIGTTVALLFGTLGLPALLEVGGPIAVTLAVLVPISLVCAHPKVLTWLVQKFLAVVRRPPLESDITWRGVGAVAGWCAFTWVAYGVHLWLLANSQAAPGIGGLLRSTGALALGMTAGVFAFLVPSGLGVREAIVVAALLPYVPAGTALGMALASRMLFIIGDLVAAGAATVLAVRSRRAGVPAPEGASEAP